MTQTLHRIYFKSAARMAEAPSGRIDLIVTSPPYPMIEMWDEILAGQGGGIRGALATGKGFAAFEAMHRVLDAVWDEAYRALKPGGFACINIGDATRTIGGEFALYPNHARILSKMVQIGFTPLPEILWRKQTNAPNKFMGSGMLPAGAYVTLEHEFILILRKGGKREFSTPDEKAGRRRGAFFWEERNQWFSDVWMDLKGVTQTLFDAKTRQRSGAFPFELPYRLINMYSTVGDLVLDPFAGIGTTMLAAMAAARNSVGYELDPGVQAQILAGVDQLAPFANERINRRLAGHVRFIAEREPPKGGYKHVNAHYGFPVITSQEKELLLNALESVRHNGKDTIEAVHSDRPQTDFETTGGKTGSRPPMDRKTVGRKTVDGKTVDGKTVGGKLGRPKNAEKPAEVQLSLPD